MDLLEIIPGAEAVAMIDAEADWREHDIVGPMWARFNTARDGGFDTK
ncbi:hypothetical protein [Salinibacterium sp.]|nr:hypothetical protein [Salinibacterium sp.]